MAAPKKYSAELRERATRMAVEARKDPAGRTGAIRRIAEQLDVHPEALRTWVRRAETDEGLREGTTSADAALITELEREHKELRRANAILVRLGLLRRGGPPTAEGRLHRPAQTGVRRPADLRGPEGHRRRHRAEHLLRGHQQAAQCPQPARCAAHRGDTRAPRRQLRRLRRPEDPCRAVRRAGRNVARCTVPSYRCASCSTPTRR
jgi:transposase